MENDAVVSKQDPDLMRMRLREIEKIVNERPEDRVDSEFLCYRINKVLEELPKNFIPKNPTLRNKAKAAFVKYTAREAGGKWKKLSENEQELWIGYVEGRVDYRTLLTVFGDKVE